MTFLVIYVGIILVATGWPIPEGLPETGFPLDKIIHFFIFLTLAIVALRVLKKRDALLLVISVAIWSELQQFFVPVRTVEAPDLIANLIGGSVPIILKR